MAEPIGSRVPPRPGGLYGQDRRETQRQIRQLQQPRVKFPKPAAGGGSVADIAAVYTNGTVGIQWPAGNSDLSFGTPAYEGGASWLSISGGNIAVTQDGSYEAVCWVDLRWASQAAAPGASLSVFLNGDLAFDGAEYAPIIQAGTQWGVVKPFTKGPEQMSAGDFWRLEADGLAASSADIARSAAVWKIVRYS